jgi:hypothetical protein
MFNYDAAVCHHLGNIALVVVPAANLASKTTRPRHVGATFCPWYIIWWRGEVRGLSGLHGLWLALELLGAFGGVYHFLDLLVFHKITFIVPKDSWMEFLWLVQGIAKGHGRQGYRKLRRHSSTAKIGVLVLLELRLKPRLSIIGDEEGSCGMENPECIIVRMYFLHRAKQCRFSDRDLMFIFWKHHNEPINAEVCK